MEGCSEGETEGVVQVIFGSEIPVGRLQRKSKLRYREQGEQEERDRVVFVWVHRPTTSLLSQQSGDGGWGPFSTVITGGQQAAFSAALLSSAGLDSRPIFCVCVCSCLEGEVGSRLCKKRTRRPLSACLDAQCWTQVIFYTESCFYCFNSLFFLHILKYIWVKTFLSNQSTHHVTVGSSTNVIQKGFEECNIKEVQLSQLEINGNIL